MSDVGVWGSLNQQLQDYGDLVDRVLLSCRVGSRAVDMEARRQLAMLLLSLDQEPTSRTWSHSAVRLLLHLGATTDPGAREEFTRLGQTLLAGTNTPTLVAELEALALRIEAKRAEAAAELRRTIG